MAAENQENTEMQFELEGNNQSIKQEGINDFVTYTRQTKIFLYLYECFRILPPQSPLDRKVGCEVIKCNRKTTLINAYLVYIHCLTARQKANEREWIDFN